MLAWTSLCHWPRRLELLSVELIHFDDTWHEVWIEGRLLTQIQIIASFSLHEIVGVSWEDAALILATETILLSISEPFDIPCWSKRPFRVLIASHLHLNLILEHFPIGTLPATPLTSYVLSHLNWATLLRFNLLEHVMNFISVFKLTDRVTGRWAKGLIWMLSLHSFVPSIRVHELSHKFIDVVFACCGSVNPLVWTLTPLHYLSFTLFLLFLRHLEVVIDLVTRVIAVQLQDSGAALRSWCLLT